MINNESYLLPINYYLLMPIIIRFLTIITWGILGFINPIFQWPMGIFISVFFMILGLVSLIWWWEMLVTWSSSVAKKFSIPPIVIGLTVLAFWTSAPELFVNLIASAKWETGLLISNVIGSNLSNILLIGGTAAIITQLPVNKNTLRKEIPFSLLVTALAFFLINDIFLKWSSANILSLWDWIILLAFFGGFLWYVFQLVKSHNTNKIQDKTSESDGPSMSIWKSLFSIGLGIYGLYVWWELIVNYASLLAEMFGVSKVMIGASIVAIGTSIPELVTSVIAARSKQTDMAVWNIIGSNIFNIVWIIGLCSVIRPVPIVQSLNIDIILLFGVTILLRVILYTNKHRVLKRWRGIFMIVLYVCYLWFLLRRG